MLSSRNIYGNFVLFKVLIVAGGVHSGDVISDTTEKHVIGEDSWTIIKPLPRIMSGLVDATVSMNDKIYIFGKQGPTENNVLTMQSLCCRWLRYGSKWCCI